MSTNFQVHVKGQLSNIQGKTKKSVNNVFLQCPFHKGDNTPSLSVNINYQNNVPVGWYHCFGCGVSGPWNTLAQKLGLQPFNSKPTEDFQSSIPVDDLHKRLFGETSPVTLPEKCIPWTKGNWRGISQAALSLVEAKYLPTTKHLILPLVVQGELVTYIQATLVKTKTALSYIVAKNTSTKAKGLYPYDNIKKLCKNALYIVLVEGCRDALRLIDNGIPALAMIGTQSWSATKQRLFIRLCRKYDAKPLLMLDGDAPGRKAQKEVYELLKKEVDVEQIRLSFFDKSNTMDPGNMPLKLVKQLYNFVRKEK